MQREERRAVGELRYTHARGLGSRSKQELPLASARFKTGDKVIARRDIGTTHTRLTGYVRGRAGVVDSVIGPQPLPDEAAVGTILDEQTYVVRFRMADLWPEASDSKDSLLIDLWDSYLEPA